MSKLIGGLPFGKLQIVVAEAFNVFSNLQSAPPSLYCSISHPGKKHAISLQTYVSKDSLHPIWYEEFLLMLDDLSCNVKFTLKGGENQKKGKSYGEAILDLSSIQLKERVEEWFPLSPFEEDSSTSDCTKSAVGKLKLVYCFTPLASLPGNFVRMSRKLAPFRLDVTKAEVVSGGYVEGTVTLLSATPVELNRLNLRITGTESVNWNEEDRETPSVSSSSVINKWYHGWENTQKTIDPGNYTWKFRVKVPEGLPPTYESIHGKITYEIQAYMDHDYFTEGTPLTVLIPPTTFSCPEVSQNKHNVQVNCSLDKPVYYLEDSPIRILIPISIKNSGEHKVKSVKVSIIEHACFSASGLLSNQKILFEEHFRNIIGAHEKWEGKLLADLPPDYSVPTVPKNMGTTKISCTHSVKIAITKDTPIVESRLTLDLNMTIARRGATGGEESPSKRKQFISLTKNLVSSKPSSPVKDTKNKPSVPVKDTQNQQVFKLSTTTTEIPKDNWDWLTAASLPHSIISDLQSINFITPASPMTSPRPTSSLAPMNLPLPSITVPLITPQPTVGVPYQPSPFSAGGVQYRPLLPTTQTQPPLSLHPPSIQPTNNLLNTKVVSSLV